MAVGFQLGDGGVNLILQVGVFLGDGDGVILNDVGGLQNLQPIVLLHKDLGGLVVDDHGVDLALFQGGDGLDAALEFLEGGFAQQAVADVAFDVDGTGGSSLGRR